MLFKIFIKLIKNIEKKMLRRRSLLMKSDISTQTRLNSKLLLEKKGGCLRSKRLKQKQRLDKKIEKQWSGNV